MKLLITVGSGLIGSSIARGAYNRYKEIYIVDNQSAYPFDYAHTVYRLNPDRVKIINLDITQANDFSRSLDHIKPDHVVHCAALADVGVCVRAPEQDFLNNVIGTQNVLDACLKSKVKRFIFMSSASVYGNTDGLARSETHPLQPISTYANSKAWGETQAQLYYKLYNLPTTSLRLFSVYGIPQIPKPGSHGWCIAIFALNAILGKPITIYGEGKQVRDFTHIDDITEAVMRTLDTDKTIGQIFNVGAGNPVSISKIACSIRSLAVQRSIATTFTYKPLPAGDPLGSYADNSKCVDLLHWKPEILVNDKLEEYFDWLSIVINHNTIPAIREYCQKFHA